MTTPDDQTDTAPARGARRRLPAWVWVLAGLLVAAVVVGVVLAQANNSPEPAPLPPPAATVTLPPPTPTIDPIDPGEGTEFFEALPRTLLSYALASSEEDPAPVLAGALEAYALTYTDGADVTLSVHAAQHRDTEAAESALAAAVAELTDDGASPAPEIEEGPVEVDGEQVGRHVTVRTGDQASVLWTNGTALLRIAGPADAVQDAYAAFPL